MNDPLLAWRPEFPILEKTVYMISNSMGAMPRGVYDKLHEYADVWARRGVRGWDEGWWALSQVVGDKIGRILGAPPGTVSMHQNVTIASAVILSALDFSGRRNKVVMTAMDFPSVIYLHQRFLPPEARLVLVPTEDGISIPLDRLLEAIDEETRLVATSLVLYKSAFIQDAVAIIRRAHAVGAYVALDVYQATGTVPFDVQALGVDFVVGGCHKWLCGGPGGGYLYVRPDLGARLEPRLTGWFAHARPFQFELEHDYQAPAYRFLNGTLPLPALYAVQPGLDIVHQIGVEAIRAKSMRQTARLIELAEGRGWKVTAPRNPAQRGGTVAIDVPDGYTVSEKLVRRNFMVDYRPGAGIRVSPHFYNSDDELELTVREIEKILRESSGVKG